MAAKTKSPKAAAQDFSALGAPELRNELQASLSKRGKLEFQHNVAPLKNPMELRVLRRDIARLKTFIRMKEAAK